MCGNYCVLLFLRKSKELSPGNCQQNRHRIIQRSKSSRGCCISCIYLWKIKCERPMANTYIAPQAQDQSPCMLLSKENGFDNSLVPQQCLSQPPVLLRTPTPCSTASPACPTPAVWLLQAEDGTAASKSRAIRNWGGTMRWAASRKGFQMTIAQFNCRRASGKEKVKL